MDYELRMQPQVTWRIYEVCDNYEFIRHLDMLFPEGKTLVLESCLSEDVREFFRQRNAQEISRGRACLFNPLLPFIVKRPETVDLHVPLTRENLDALYNYQHDHCELDICSHLNIRDETTMLMEGHDWFCSDASFYVTGEVDESKVKAFCEAVGCKYERSLDYGPVE